MGARSLLHEAGRATGVTSGATALRDVGSVRGPRRGLRPREHAVELRTGLELLRLVGAAPRLGTAPRGDGGPVIDIPGWRAPEVSGLPIRTYLRALGHDARGWGRGTNLGRPEEDARALAINVREVAEKTGRRVALVGWSLGGVIAREVARAHPDIVRQVITYGTPIYGRPSNRPISIPLTIIFTRRDGVVPWRSCLDHVTPSAEHIEVGSTHLGLGIDPDVWQVVAGRLAAGGPATQV